MLGISSLGPSVIVSMELSLEQMFDLGKSLEERIPGLICLCSLWLQQGLIPFVLSLTFFYA